MTSAQTRLIVLLGHPVAHSASPQIHTAAFAASGIDAVYLACDVTGDALADALAGLRALGALGGNVTVPHKQAVFAQADVRTPEAEAVGAANTLWFDERGLVVDNTDTAGLADVLRGEVALRPGERVVVFGAGGAARAAVVAAARLGAAVQVRARRSEAAEQVAALAADWGAAAEPCAAVEDPLGDVRAVINATPLGLHGEQLPDALCALGPGQAALDLVYGPAETPFVAAARARGAQALDGLGMLVRQAGHAFERWTGQPPPLEPMATAARHALRR